MSEHNSNQIVLKREMQNPATAGLVLRKLIDRRDADGRREVMNLVKADPPLALAALQHGDDVLGLTPRGSADVAEEIIGAIGDDHKAREHVGQNLTSDRVAELLMGRGDLPSALVDIATIPQLIEAMRQDIAPYKDANEASILAPHASAEVVVLDSDRVSTPVGTSDDEDDDEEDALIAKPEGGEVFNDDEEDEEELVGDAALINDPYLRPGALLMFRSWAIRLRDRKDFAEILDQRVFGLRTFKTYLLLCFWAESFRPDDLDDVPDDCFDSIGLDPEEGRTELARIIKGGELSEIDLDPAEWHAAKAEYGARQDAIAHAPKTIDETERDKAKQAASKLNF
ncbi:hypothetical protein IT407_01825 [Candidatus Uhrbacteria bacterium]|nr:hypothetical protein [Candidatus Uhrbacteria bacterium]